jgi:hypothetical protein
VGGGGGARGAKREGGGVGVGGVVGQQLQRWYSLKLAVEGSRWEAVGREGCWAAGKVSLRFEAYPCL